MKCISFQSKIVSFPDHIDLDVRYHDDPIKKYWMEQLFL